MLFGSTQQNNYFVDEFSTYRIHMVKMWTLTEKMSLNKKRKNVSEGEKRKLPIVPQQGEACVRVNYCLRLLD